MPIADVSLDAPGLVRFPNDLGRKKFPEKGLIQVAWTRVSSVALSLTTVAGLPRAAWLSSSRARRSEVSATSARNSRVKSSMITRMRKRQPSVSVSDRKFKLQR
jgi:hypothetical protein